MDLLPLYLLCRSPKPRCGWVVRALLHRQFEVRTVIVRCTCNRLARRRGYSEAARFLDARNVNVEPLAWEELPQSADVERRRRGGRQYVYGLAVFD
jgi:hypothetical protein